jgi:hypothetical protein
VHGLVHAVSGDQGFRVVKFVAALLADSISNIGSCLGLELFGGGWGACPHLESNESESVPGIDGRKSGPFPQAVPRFSRF